MLFFLSVNIFLKFFFFFFFPKKSFRNFIRVSNCLLDSDKRSGLIWVHPNCLQRLSADEIVATSGERVYNKFS